MSNTSHVPLVSKLVKKYMEIQIVEDRVKELIDLPPKVVQKAEIK